eukprot:CAMPEP_0202445144 /NCGR_PEP_ID=MMETSP1360-20130828/4028_1 /ASSEMBLY_ACC=CAM_ASM_000848 /TAXON_ID=515479 /ORGANISM="Licmophora paradoxa, Strain CCMP2313" /LENGTH=103 /DNA_ID=CAMNT_0049061315 /DNA_START=67 /DNA_END=378 /DNA_ORIENTATION=+
MVASLLFAVVDSLMELHQRLCLAMGVFIEVLLFVKNFGPCLVDTLSIRTSPPKDSPWDAQDDLELPPAALILRKHMGRIKAQGAAAPQNNANDHYAHGKHDYQ